MKAYTVLGMTLMAALSGCGRDAAAPDGARVPGVLTVSGWTAAVPLNAGTGGNVRWELTLQPSEISAAQVIVAPDTVDAGRAFEVVTYTVGVSGCWRGDGQSVATAARTVLLRPYDAHSGSEVCTGALQFLDHRSTVVLEEAGPWTLRVHGRRLRLGDVVWDEPITAERTIVVR